MQLREVGKLAVYLWKIQWLQRPSHWALPWASCVWVEATLPWWPSGSQAGVEPPLPLLLLLCGGGLVQRSHLYSPPQCLLSGPYGTVAVQGNLTV